MDTFCDALLNMAPSSLTAMDIEGGKIERFVNVQEIDSVHDRKEPPVVLVKTWIDLLLSSEDSEVKERASTMLLNAFGNMKAVGAFAEKHQISIKK